MDENVENFKEAMKLIKKAGVQINQVYKDLEEDKHEVHDQLDELLRMLDDIPTSPVSE